jgi:uncharacterized protein with HEPN domain
VRTDRERLRDGLEAIDRCLSQAARGREAFEADPLVQVWMIHHLEILGEACKSISTDLRMANSDVPWPLIVGMRNVLVHDYFGIDLGEVWVTVERDLPTLRAQLQAIIATLDALPSE